MGRVEGNTSGLGRSLRRAIERLASRRVPPETVVGRDLARTLCALSHDTGRQIGLLIHRRGKVECVIVGDAHGILIPRLGQTRTAGGRLRGLRLVHTHLHGEGLSQEDLLDMLFLRLDMVAALTMDEAGLPRHLHCGLLSPRPTGQEPWILETPFHPARQPWRCDEQIQAIEEEFTRSGPRTAAAPGGDRAILVSASPLPRGEAEERLDELAELARSGQVSVLGRVRQRLRKVNPRTLLGRGKLAGIMLEALRLDANLLIFDQELSPSQMRSITGQTDLRVIDRTQLILDIFARRAQSREGKLQVEMAQLRYMLPRLSGRDDALSRLTGGIGTRGPGETRLEIDRRRINDRLARLDAELRKVGRQRYRRRGRRRRHEVPVLSLVGYTNAGKSTLLNTLTRSSIHAEDQLFATLDPTSRRLRFPRETEVIITDTVGFIRDLPDELLKAFAATLEELEEADLLVHVIDASSPRRREQEQVVDQVLHELDLHRIPCLKVYNKADLLPTDQARRLAGEHLLVSALDRTTLAPFLQQAEAMVRPFFTTSAP